MKARWIGILLVLAMAAALALPASAQLNQTGSLVTFDSQSGPLTVTHDGDLLELDFPSTPPAPANPAHTAIAFGRSCGGKTLVNSDSVDGMISAAPMPITQRVRMSWLALPAVADSTEPAPKISRPMLSAPLRPKRSPSDPAVSRRPANTSV